MFRTVVKIDGMMCGMCEAHINDAIRRNFNVKKVKSSHSKGETVIESETEPDAAALKRAIEEISPFFMFAISPFAAWVEIGSPVNLRAPAYKILQTPYPLGSRFIRESKLQPTLYSVNSDFVSVCIINFFRRHRPFRKTAASAVSLSGHVFNAFRAACCGRTDCSFL